MRDCQNELEFFPSFSGDKNTLNYFGAMEIMESAPTCSYFPWLKEIFHTENISHLNFPYDWSAEIKMTEYFVITKTFGELLCMKSSKDLVLKKEILGAHNLLECELLQKKGPAASEYCLLATAFFQSGIHTYSVYKLSEVLLNLDYFCEVKDLSSSNINLIAFQMLLAIHFLHSNNIIHGAILKKNVLIFGNNVRLTNFEYSALESGVSFVAKRLDIFPFNLDYVKECPLHYNTDMWQFGITFSELCLKKSGVPFLIVDNAQGQKGQFKQNVINALIKNSKLNLMQQEFVSLVLQENYLERQKANLLKDHLALRVKQWLFK